MTNFRSKYRLGQFFRKKNEKKCKDQDVEEDLTRREQTTNNDTKSVRLEREGRYRADLSGISA